MKSWNKMLSFLMFSVGLSMGSYLQGLVIDSDTINAEIRGGSTNQTVVDIMEGSSQLKTFVSLLSEADLIGSLEGAGPFTIFAPSDNAFKKLSPEILKDLQKKENKTKLAMILKNHIVSGKILTSSSLNTSNLNTLGGKPLHIQVRGSQIQIDSASLVESDLTGSNGVIQVIDTVILR